LAGCCDFPDLVAVGSGSGAGLGATEDEAVDAEAGRDTRFVGERARVGAGSGKDWKGCFLLCNNPYMCWVKI
jgi:hypothetical protein